jgi:Large eukaryotic DNA virus major capsid protein/Major capsid protein N-terminus
MVKFERGRVGTGSVLALDAIGKQDSYLYNENLADSRWDPSYTQTTNFAITQRAVTLPGSNWINHEIKVEFIPKSSGDMFSNMHLACSLPALPPGNVYTDQIGRAIFSQIDFMIDGQVIESLNDDWYILRDQLFLDADEKNAMAQAINGGYAEGTLSTLSNTPQIDMIIPLDFFFCRRHSRYKKHRERLDRPHFPTCALYNQKIYINFKFQPWSWFSNSIPDQRIGNITMNKPLVIYTSSTANSLTTGDTNVYVTDDISFWPNSNGSITIDSEQMTYTLKNGNQLNGLVRPNRTTHSNGAPITLTSNTGFTYTSNIIMYPVSNCVVGMYIYGIPTLSGNPAVINSIDSANNILNITYTNVVPTSQTYPLSFSFSKVTKNLSLPPVFISASDHYTFTFDSSANMYPGMQVNGTDIVGGPLYIQGTPVVASNNINQFYANIISNVGSTVNFYINNKVPYLTTGTTYVNFPNSVFVTLTNVNGSNLTGTVTAGNPLALSNGIVTIDSPPIVNNLVTLSYPWQQPVLADLTTLGPVNLGSSYVNGNTIVTFGTSTPLPYLDYLTTNVNFTNVTTSLLLNVAATTITANYNGSNVVGAFNGYNGSVTIGSLGSSNALNTTASFVGTASGIGNTVIGFTVTSNLLPQPSLLSSPVTFTGIAQIPIIQSAVQGYVSNISGNYVSNITAYTGQNVTIYKTSMPVTVSDNIQKIVPVIFNSPIDLTTTSNVITINNRKDIFVGQVVTGMPAITGTAYVSAINGNQYTITYPVQNQITVGFPFVSTDSNIIVNGDITFWPDINGSISINSENMLYGQKLGSNLIGVTRSENMQGYNEAGSNVTVMSLVSEGSNNLANTSTAMTNVQTVVTLSGNVSAWPASGVVQLGTSEVCPYSLSGQTITLSRVLPSVAYPQYTNVLLQNTFTLVSTLAASIGPSDTLITLTGNVASWPTTGTVLIETSEVCTYAGKSGQNITLTRGSYPRSHPAFANVVYQNTYTTSSMGIAMTPGSNTFTLSSTPFALRDWPTNNAMVVVDNETIFYGIRQGNVFSNCFNRNLVWSTHFVGESILNLRAWEFSVSVQNLTDFISAPRLLVEEIQLSEEEKQYTKAIPRRLVVNHVQRQPPLYFDQGTNGQISIGINASFPVTFLCWFIRRGDFESLTRYVDSRYSYGYTTKYINTSTPITFFNGVKLNYIDLIDSAQITLSGNSILSQIAGGLYFTMKQPFDHALSIPTKSVYIYAFGLNPKEYNQGGFMDFSPLDASTTTLSLTFKPEYATELAKAFSLYLFYYGYTILEVKDGFGRLVFV